MQLVLRQYVNYFLILPVIFHTFTGQITQKIKKSVIRSFILDVFIMSIPEVELEWNLRNRYMNVQCTLYTVHYTVNTKILLRYTLILKFSVL